MCGIAGGFGGLTRTDADAIAKGIVQEIRYRGPDADAVEHFENGFFVHLRLAIIDLSAGGAQPKWSADRRYCITYNGEIYNYKELRATLAAMGHTFSTDSDSEVLLKVWEVWGSEGLARCIGMYAFALFDSAKQELHLARDTYGIKPLYIAETTHGLRFASTYPAMSRFPDCPRRVNARRAFEFARYGMLDKRNGTLVDGFRALDPGTVETWSVARGAIRRVESRVITRPDYRVAERPLSFSQAAEKLREDFLLSVRLHMRSDVPVGFALSGGVDSSAIVCAARMLEPDADLRTFTFAAGAEGVDETGWAKIVSDHTKATPHYIRLRSDHAVESLEQIVRTFGVPPNSMGTPAACQVLRTVRESGITVLLNGQGGDETFGGYMFHLGAALAGYMRRGELVAAERLFCASSRMPRTRWWTIGAWGLDQLLPQTLKRAARRAAGYEHLPDWMDRRWLDGEIDVPIRDLGPQLHKFGADVLGERLAYDMTDLVLPDLLLYDDRESMQASIESRVPILAKPITDLAYSVPSSYHIGPDGVTKRLFREAMRGILPEEIRTRSDKVGYEAPQARWLSAERERVEAILNSDAARSVKLFDHDKLIARWRAIDSPTHWDFKYVWRWIGLALWSDAFAIAWT